MRTKGNAGYRVWKSAGGQGDQDISLSFGSFGDLKIFLFFEAGFFGANPLLISKAKLNINKNKKKGDRYIYNDFWLFIEAKRG